MGRIGGAATLSDTRCTLSLTPERPGRVPVDDSWRTTVSLYVSVTRLLSSGRRQPRFVSS